MCRETRGGEFKQEGETNSLYICVCVCLPPSPYSLLPLSSLSSAMSVRLHWFPLGLFLAPADWSRGRRRRRASIMLLLVVGEREKERVEERQTVNMEEEKR